MTSVDGWSLFAHPLFLDQLEKLITAVETARRKNPDGYRDAANVKLLAALRQLVFETIPQDPTRGDCRQGGTLDGNRKHWFRAKFGAQRFRLFFRYSSKAKVIVYAWVNDQDLPPTCGAGTDAYALFRGMVDNGDPPEDWGRLLAAASTTSARERLDRVE